jgi:hypothetical protein
LELQEAVHRVLPAVLYIDGDPQPAKECADIPNDGWRVRHPSCFEVVAAAGAQTHNNRSRDKLSVDFAGPVENSISETHMIAADQNNFEWSL